MQKTSVYLPPRLKQALAVRAVATGRSEAEVIRAALEAEVHSEGAAGLPEAAGVGLRLAQAGGADAPVPGRLVGIGVGPGEADLVTVRALVALRRADRVVAPATAVDAVGRAEAIVRQAVPGLRVERIPFAMAPDRAERDRSIAEAAEVLAGYLGAGQEVAFVTLGDPLTYSTFTAVAAAVREGRPATVVEQVPGIMAFQALAARTGTTVTDERQRLLVRTALDGEDVATELDDHDVTVVLYKGGRRLPDLAKAAAAAGRLAGAVAGELLGMPGERIGALSDLAADGPASYLATVIIPATAPSEPTALAAFPSGQGSSRLSGTIPAQNAGARDPANAPDGTPGGPRTGEPADGPDGGPSRRAGPGGRGRP